MNKLKELENFVEDRLRLVRDKTIILNKVSAKTWIIIGIIFALLSAFWEWTVGWLGSLILGKTFFIYPYSSLKYTSLSGMITWGIFTTVLAFIAMQVTKLDTITNVKKTLKGNHTLVIDFLKGKFVLPKKIPVYAILVAGVAGAIVGTMCEGLWGWISQFVRGEINYIYPGSILKYTSFASIPIWGLFSAVYFVLTYNLILLLEKNQVKNG